MNTSQYEADFYKWIYSQAELLKNGQLEKLDITNLVEEIETLGRNDKKSLKNQFIRLLKHLLKKEFQPEKQIDSNSWEFSIRNAKREILYLIKDSPSLKNELIKMFDDVYDDSRYSASGETRLDLEIFPEICPWTIEELFPELNEKS